MDNKKDDKYYLEKILLRINKIIEYIDGVDEMSFARNEQLQESILFNIEQLVENSKRLSNEFKNTHSTIPWSNMIGLRNKIIHDYESVNVIILYSIITTDIPSLKRYLHDNKLI